MENVKSLCPRGHGEMRAGTIAKTTDFRGESLACQLDCLVCPVCGLIASTVEQTAIAQTILADAYRQKAGLLTGAEIKEYRERLGLSQRQLAEKIHSSKMSIIRWENGAVQKEASDLTLRRVLCPEDNQDEFSGNRPLTLGRIKAVLLEFEKHVPYQLLIPGDKGLYAGKNCWYADLLGYRECRKGMTGATYSVMTHGPQLDNFADLQNEIIKADPASVEPLSERELTIIKRLSALFSRQRDAYDAALQEPAWQEMGKDFGRRISYRIAFRLKAV
jgi:putative zinc finger/helix-turn-helix YgiT family protein